MTDRTGRRHSHTQTDRHQKNTGRTRRVLTDCIPRSLTDDPELKQVYFYNPRVFPSLLCFGGRRKEGSFRLSSDGQKFLERFS